MGAVEEMQSMPGAQKMGSGPVLPHVRFNLSDILSYFYSKRGKHCLLK